MFIFTIYKIVRSGFLRPLGANGRYGDKSPRNGMGSLARLQPETALSCAGHRDWQCGIRDYSA